MLWEAAPLALEPTLHGGSRVGGRRVTGTIFLKGTLRGWRDGSVDKALIKCEDTFSSHDVMCGAARL